MEPFSRDGRDRRRLRPTSVDELESMLGALWERYSAIKHVWLYNGWPFERGSELNRALLLGGAPRVVFLTRRNLLRLAVSDQLAAQTGVYNRSDYPRADPLAFDYRPLDEEAIRAALEGPPPAVAAHRRALRESTLEVREVEYETFYDPEIDTDERVRRVLELLSFLGYDPDLPGVDRVGIARLMDPAKSRLNPARVLLRVPGIEDIERRFGSDETGWLFR